MHTLHLTLLKNSYTILAPTVLPKGFVDAKEASLKVVKEIALDENDYRFGHTKVPIIVLIKDLCIYLVCSCSLSLTYMLVNVHL